MKIIDCNACIGHATVNRLMVNHENFFVCEQVKQPKNASELLEEMDYNGIDEAIVCNTSMLHSGVMLGNDELLADKANYTGRLHGTIVLLPSFLNECFLPERVFDTICQNNLFGVRVNPKANRHWFDKISMGDIAEMLQEKQIPVYLSPDYGWEEVRSALQEFPSLKVILTNYGPWGSDGYLYPLLKAFPNLYFDTSDLHEIIGVEALVNRFGSDRILFGSNYPCVNMGAPLTAILGARISARDKEKILGENVSRLIEGRILK